MSFTTEQKKMIKKAKAGKLTLRIMEKCYNCSEKFDEKTLVQSEQWLGKVCHECFESEESDEDEDEDDDEEDEEVKMLADAYHGEEYIGPDGVKKHYCKGCDEFVPVCGWDGVASDTLCINCEDDDEEATAVALTRVFDEKMKTPMGKMRVLQYAF